MTDPAIVSKVEKIRIRPHSWSRRNRGTTRQELERSLHGQGISRNVRVIEDNKSHEFIILAIGRDGYQVLGNAAEEIARVMRGIGTRSENINFEIPENNQQQTSSAPSSQAFNNLQSKMSELRRDIQDRDTQLAELTAKNVELEEIIGQDSSTGRRGDFHVKDQIRLGRVEELKSISTHYGVALENSPLDTTGDLNQQIIDGARAADVPYELSEAYKASKVVIEQAREAIKSADEGNRFVNRDAAQSVINSADQAKTTYNESSEAVQLLRSALNGKSALYLVTSEEDDSTYKINVVLPIEHQIDDKDFSELEKDLISQVREQWSKIRRSTPGNFSRQDRLGLVEYTFSVPKSTVTPDKMKNLEYQLAHNIIDSQHEYSFGALGFNIDLELVVNTKGLQNREHKYESTQRRIPQPTVASPIQRGTSATPSGPQTVDIEGMFEALRSQDAYALPLDKLKFRGQSQSRYIQLAALTALAESTDSLYTKQIKTRIVDILSNQGIKLPDGNKLHYLINQATIKLRKVGIIEKVDDSAPQKTSYKIKEEHRK